MEKLGRFIDRNLREIILLISTVLFTSTSAFFGKEEPFIGTITKDQLAWSLITIAVIINLSLIAFDYINKQKYLTNDELKRENKELVKHVEIVEKEYYRLCSDVIYNTFLDFCLNANHRISIYIHQGDHFTILGRYCKVSSNNKPNRIEYPDNEGFISYGWNSHEYYIGNIPKWKGNGKEYKDYTKKHCNISTSTLSKLKMKSRAFYVSTLHDPSTSEDPDGVIVFESLDPASFSKEEVKKKLEDNIIPTLSLLKNMKTLTRKLNNRR